TERRQRARGIAGAPEESAEEVAVRLELGELELDQDAEPPGEVLRGRERTAERRVELRVGLPVEGHDDGPLRRKAVVRGAGRDGGPSGDLAHRRLGEPPLLKEVQGRGENSAAGVFRLRSWARLVIEHVQLEVWTDAAVRSRSFLNRFKLRNKPRSINGLRVTAPPSEHVRQPGAVGGLDVLNPVQVLPSRELRRGAQDRPRQEGHAGAGGQVET